MSETNRALTQRWMDEVWNQRSDATLDELLSPDAVGYFEGIGTCGKAEFAAARAQLLTIFPDLRVTIEDLVDQGDNVITRWCVDATHAGALPDLPASGKKVQFRGITWMIWNTSGQIVRGWDAWNQAALVAELQAAARAACP